MRWARLRRDTFNSFFAVEILAGGSRRWRSAWPAAAALDWTRRRHRPGICGGLVRAEALLAHAAGWHLSWRSVALWMLRDCFFRCSGSRLDRGRFRLAGECDASRQPRIHRISAIDRNRQIARRDQACNSNGKCLSESTKAPKRVRTIFLSDIHLGTKGCQADKLLDFMRWYDADTIYLVGDIVDGWQLKSAWYWPQAHNDVVQKLLRKARKGARIIYIPGNHDEFLRDYYGTHFGGIEVMEDAIHVGRRWPALPGDPRRPVRRGHPPCPLARLAGRQGLRVRDLAQHQIQCDPTGVRLDLLVAVAMGQAEGEERGQFHRRVSSRRWPTRRAGAAPTA